MDPSSLPARTRLTFLVAQSAPFACDASSAESLESAFAEIRKTYPDHQLKVGSLAARGVPAKREQCLTRSSQVACFNANAPFVMKPFLELKPSEMQTGIDLNMFVFVFPSNATHTHHKNSMGAFHFSQLVVPLMLEHQTGGTLIFSGATAALKGPTPSRSLLSQTLTHEPQEEPSSPPLRRPSLLSEDSVRRIYFLEIGRAHV